MPPANTSFATAVSIATLPYDFTQTDINDAGVNFTVYYKFIAPAGAKVVGAWGFSGNIGAGYRPTIKPYNGPAGAPTQILLIAAQNKPIQFPVVPGNEYFLEFVKNTDTAGPEDLRIRVEIAPDQTIVAGSILVNDDTDGFPLAVLSGVNDNTVINFVKDIPGGEAGDILPTGVMAFENAFTVPETIRIYSKSFVLLNTLTLDNPRIRTCLGTGKFWAGSNVNPATATTILASGVFGATTFTLTGNTSLHALAANDAETILYFANVGNGVVVKRWDLALNAAMSDLAAGIAGYQIPDILYLSDNTIVVLYYSSGTKDVQAIRYSTAGAVLNTYALGAQTATTKPRACYALDSPNSFWVWTHNTGGVSIFRNVKASDGSILTTRTHTEYEGGAMVAGETAAPTSRFGNSFSCPFMMMAGDVPYSGIYIIVPGKTDDTVKSGAVTTDLAIPDPTFRTGLLG